MTHSNVQNRQILPASFDQFLPFSIQTRYETWDVGIMHHPTEEKIGRRTYERRINWKTERSGEMAHTLATYSISANLKARPRQPNRTETREQASQKVWSRSSFPLRDWRNRASPSNASMTLESGMALLIWAASLMVAISCLSTSSSMIRTASSM